MNPQETGTRPSRRTAASSTTAIETNPQRARVLERTYCRCFANCSWASCSARDSGDVMSGNLHPEQVACLEEEPVAAAAQRLECECVGLVERRPVPEKEHGAGRGPVGEEEVVPEIVHDLGLGLHVCPTAGVEPIQRLPRARVHQRRLILRQVLAHVTEEDRPRQLVL